MVKMINKYPSYSLIVEWANKLKDYELDNVYFSVKGKPRVKLKHNKFHIYCSEEREALDQALAEAKHKHEVWLVAEQHKEYMARMRLQAMGIKVNW